jgi:UDP-2,3-diacylglucosamine hydrolase
MQNGMPQTKTKHINVSSNEKIYFVSDHHFGLEAKISSKEREKKFVSWLENIKNNAKAIFILGDMFDYWYEYKRAVPKGSVRVLGKLAELSDKGVLIYFFVGNHDMWMMDYLEKEIGITTFFKPEIFTINQKQFLLGHGDGLGPGDKNYKLLKKLFTNQIAQWMFRWIHPDAGLKLIKYLSQKNKLISGEYNNISHGKEKEWLFLYAQNYLKTNNKINYFIFGHRHLPLKMPINEQSTYYNTGDWLVYFTFLEFDGNNIFQKKIQ